MSDRKQAAKRDALRRLSFEPAFIRGLSIEKCNMTYRWQVVRDRMKQAYKGDVIISEYQTQKSVKPRVEGMILDFVKAEHKQAALDFAGYIDRVK